MGAKGFVGSAFSKYLSVAMPDYKPIDRDNYHLYVDSKCDIMINANGSSKKYLSEQDPKLDFRLNVVSVIDSLKDFNCGLYVLLSTIDVYTDVSNPKYNHESVHIDAISLSNYGFHKYLAELCVMKYSHKWLIIRLGGMVGEGLKKNPVYDILHSQPLRVNPKSKYQYINTSQVAHLTYQLITDGHCNEVFNLCGDGLISLTDVQKAYGVPYAENGLRQENYNINIQKLEALYNVPPTVSTIESFFNAKPNKIG